MTALGDEIGEEIRAEVKAAEQAIQALVAPIMFIKLIRGKVKMRIQEMIAFIRNQKSSSGIQILLQHPRQHRQEHTTINEVAI